MDVHTTGSFFGVDSNGANVLVIHFDINGNKAPNTVGRDIFVTVFTENGFVPAYKDKTAAQIKSDCTNSGYGFACLMLYLNKA